MKKRQKGSAAAAVCQLRDGTAHPFTALRGFDPWVPEKSKSIAS